KGWNVLHDGAPMRAVDIPRECGVSAATIRAMAEAGVLRTVNIAPDCPGVIEDVPAPALDFSAQQAEAAAALRDAVAAQKYAAILLDGVTGSGKTEVYFEAVAEALRQGKQALVLLPEISLSAQFLARFERRFGVAPAVWHSEVSQAKRRETWRGVAEGKTRIVIGARSALFLPFSDLGVIVVDEEHDASYKQEEGVLYHARDMSVLRASLAQMPVVLVSATPSLETMTNARQGKYQYLHLPVRHAGAHLPDVFLVDLKRDPPPRRAFLSETVRAALAETFQAGEQSLLFLNRRGYAPLTLCRTCGFRFQCPSCSAWLVEHRRHGHLQCHHCGHTARAPSTCPECKDEDSLVACGPGVERIEEEVKALLPDARTLVLASDIFTGADIHGAIKKIENREIDVMIGTQLVAKGHHFPALTLVGIVDADLGLAGGDLRAGERTFQLLHQVAGRAGRAEKPGRVFVQTYMPEQPVIAALSKHDRDGFLAAEAEERECALMPPFGRLAAVIVSGQNEAQVDALCRKMIVNAPRYDDITVLGPAPAPLAYLRGKHRRRFLVKTGRDVSVQKYMAGWLSAVKIPSAIQVKVDIDPQSFF
ncbi:MAG: primosomal protein N', partial [Alphaproteobacteria bacterium]|nr:primosomal protein N' [Alphaproteobacteria bacterium]